MICPLLIPRSYGERITTLKDAADCLKGNCAWWDETKNCCAVKEAGRSLGLMLAVMPKESAFKK